MSGDRHVVNDVQDAMSMVGRELGPGPWICVTQEMVNGFGEVTRDQQWLHCDVERAARGPYGGTIVHGFLILSLTLAMMRDVVEYRGAKMGVNYGLNRVRFTNVVPVDSRLRLRSVVKSVELISGGAQVVQSQTIEMDGAAKPACIAEGITRVYFN